MGAMQEKHGAPRVKVQGYTVSPGHHQVELEEPARGGANVYIIGGHLKREIEFFVPFWPAKNQIGSKESRRTGNENPHIFVLKPSFSPKHSMSFLKRPHQWRYISSSSSKSLASGTCNTGDNRVEKQTPQRTLYWVTLLPNHTPTSSVSMNERPTERLSDVPFIAPAWASFSFRNKKTSACNLQANIRPEKIELNLKVRETLDVST